MTVDERYHAQPRPGIASYGPEWTRTAQVAVVVVTWNSARMLPGLLGSLADGLAGVRWRLIVADNDSRDDSVAIAQRLVPGCRIVQTGRNAGYAAAFNAALAAAGEYDAVLVLNPDVRLAPGCVAGLLAGLGPSAGGTVGVVVPRMSDARARLSHSLRREPTIRRALGEALVGQRAGRWPAWGETVLDDAAYQRRTVTDWATGAAMLISAKCLAACGPWDESFFLYSEETEFALRARDRGFTTLLVPEAEAVHVGGDSRVSPALWSLLTVNRVRLFRKRHSAPATLLFWLVVLVREASRAVLGQRRARRAVAALLQLTALPPDQDRPPPLRDRLFPQGPALRVTARGVLLTVLAVLGGTALSLYRNTGVGPLDTTVMEDARVFLADQVNLGFFRALVTPYSGYFHLLPRLLAGIAALFPPDLAAAVMATEAALVTALLAVAVYFASAGLLPTRVQRLLVSAPMVVMPVAQVELFNEINMLRWQLMYATFWVAFWVARGRGGRIAATLVLVAAGSSDNVVWLFLPLLVLRWFAWRGTRRDRTALIGGAALALGAVASFASVVAGVSSRGVTPRLDPVWAVSAYILRPVPQMMVGSRWVGESPAHTLTGVIPVAAGWLVLLAVVLVAARRSTRPDWLLAGIAFTMGTLLYLYTIMVVGVAGPRYSAPAGMLVLTAVVALLTPRADRPGRPRRAAVAPLAAFTALFLLVCAFNIRMYSWRSDGPRWSDELRQARAVCAQPGVTSADITVSPAFIGWSARLPCSYLRR